MQFDGRVRQLDIQPKRSAFQAILESSTNVELIVETVALAAQFLLGNALLMMKGVALEYALGAQTL